MKWLKHMLRKLIIIFVVVSVLVLGSVFVLGYISYSQMIKKAPIVETIGSIMNSENYVEYEELSPYLINATIAIEDRDFFDHSGIDFKAILRSLISNVSTGSVVSGGSTITQQVVKNIYFDFDYSFLRKITEIFFSRDIEKLYSKEEILALYMNIINYGDNHIGIYEASYGYFNKSPKELGLIEASLVAGIPQSPSYYQLSNHLEEALEKQKIVLKAMLECNMLTEDEQNYIRDLYNITK